MFKIKMKPQSYKEKNKADTYGAPIFAPDNSATILAAKCVPTPMSIPSILDFYGINRLPLTSCHRDLRKIY